MTVQVQFMTAQLALISVPLSKYPLIYHGLVQMVLKTWKSDPTQAQNRGDADNFRQVSEKDYDDDDNESEDEFFNIGFTPYECSIICPTDWIEPLFGTLLSDIAGVEIAPSNYIAIKVDGEGRDGSTRRILRFSAPLSEAKIPIFFLSTYFSDYLLIPSAFKDTVETILIKEGFLFSSLENSYMGGRKPEQIQNDTLEETKEDLKQLQGLLNPDLVPILDPSTKLLLTGARQNYEVDTLELAIVRTLVSPPTYFSLIKHSSELSFLVDTHTVGKWPASSLLGSQKDYVVPITIDLANMPLDVVGVVAGISAKLLEKDISMSYVSTAHSCVVLIDMEDQQEAEQGLRAGSGGLATAMARLTT